MLSSAFLQPLLLLTTIPTILAIIVLYAKFGRLKERVVPSLFFIKQLKSETKRGKKANFPPRFFWDALLALLLVSLLAIPTDKDATNQTAILIDTSASMLALQADGETTFQKALGYISRTNADYLFITTPKLTEVGGAPDKLQPSLNTTKLEDAFSPLALHETVNRLVILSDQKIQATVARSLFIETPQLSKPQNNYAIQQAVLTEQGYLVDVKSYSHVKQNIVITMGAEGEQKLSATIDPDKVATVGPFKVSADTSTIEFSLSPDDALREDNKIVVNHLWAKPIVTLVASDSFDGRELNNITTYDIKRITPDKYDSKQNTNMTIFYRSVPTAFPDHPFMIIAPPAKSTLFGQLNNLSAQTISYIDNAHPIFRYLTPEKLGMPDFYALESIFGAPLLKFGEHTGITLLPHKYRNIVIGFDIFPLANSFAANILFLNALKWLNETSNQHQANYFPEGESELRQKDIIKLDANKIKRIPHTTPNNLSLFKMFCLLFVGLLLADLLWLWFSRRRSRLTSAASALRPQS